MNKKCKKSVAFSMNAKVSFKLIVVGNKHAGKTSLILRFVKDFFEINYKVTIGVQFYSKIIQQGDEEIAIQIWDTAGSENYKSVVRSFYNFAHCVIIVYDTNNQLQTNIENWMTQIKNNAHELAKVVLVRTKTDLNPMTQQQKAQVQQIVQKHSIQFFMPVSSKLNQNVSQMFTRIGSLLNQLYKTDENFKKIVQPKNESILLTSSEMPGNNKNKKTKCCSS